MAWTKRPQNHCKTCGYTWYPRGKSISHKCPRCGSEDTGLFPSISTIVGTGLLAGVLIIPCVIFANWDKGEKNARQANQIPRPAEQISAPALPPKLVEQVTPPNDKKIENPIPKPINPPMPEPDPAKEKEIIEKKEKEAAEAKKLDDEKKLLDGVAAIRSQVDEMNKATIQFKKSVEEGLEPFKSERYFSRIKARNTSKKIEDEIKRLNGLPMGKESTKQFEADLAKTKAILDQFKE